MTDDATGAACLAAVIATSMWTGVRIGVWLNHIEEKRRRDREEAERLREQAVREFFPRRNGHDDGFKKEDC